MTEFFEAVTRYEFMRNAIVTGILASIACGVVGTYVVTRRITYIAVYRDALGTGDCRRILGRSGLQKNAWAEGLKYVVNGKMMSEGQIIAEIKGMGKTADDRILGKWCK